MLSSRMQTHLSFAVQADQAGKTGRRLRSINRLKILRLAGPAVFRAKKDFQFYAGFCPDEVGDVSKTRIDRSGVGHQTDTLTAESLKRLSSEDIESGVNGWHGR